MSLLHEKQDVSDIERNRKGYYFKIDGGDMKIWILSKYIICLRLRNTTRIGNVIVGA